MLCSYSICSVYKNNGNIQNAINIITRLQAITICVKTVRETQALNILLLRQEVYCLPQNQRSFTTMTTGVFQFIQYTGVLTSM